jgi:diguanylate cyclase (GGDEF)-like protein
MGEALARTSAAPNILGRVDCEPASDMAYERADICWSGGQGEQHRRVGRWQGLRKGSGSSKRPRDPRAMRRRPSRLVLHFILIMVIGLAGAGAGVFVLARSFTLRQERADATSHARVVANVLLADELRPSDFRSPSRVRLSTFDRLFRRQILLDGVVGGSLYDTAGRVVYSTNHAPLGSTTDISDLVHQAGILQRVTSKVVMRAVDDRKRKVLVTIVPVRSESQPAATAGEFVVWSDYAKIEAAANRTLVPVAIVLSLLLLALFVALLPVLRRTTRAIRSHLDASEFDALHDGLTGLPNRRLFWDRLAAALARAQRDGRPAAVMLLDLNGFKRVNDTLGHAAGDELLREVATRLDAVLRDADTVARLGGDEFAIVLNGISLQDACDTATRVHDALRKPMTIQGVALSVGGSVGIALHPIHGDSASILVQRADVAMYEAKQSGEPYAVYDPETDSNDAALLSLATDLTAALETEQIVLHYQPKIDLRTGERAGVEALLRWKHPSLGLLEAQDFMHVAEQCGVVGRISELAVETAIHQCSLWQADGVVLPIAVNLAARNLVDRRFASHVAELLERYGVDASQIELEITESSIMRDPGRVRGVALELAEIGIGLAIDDFGTGYSSLSYLSQLPITKLKIDRSFVAAMTKSEREQSIVRATIELAHGLGLETVAEGVEDAETLELLRDLGADIVQGYYIGSPVEPRAVLWNADERIAV